MFYAICNWQLATGNCSWQLATCNLQLATLIAQFVCSLIFHAIIQLVYHLYSIYLMMLFVLLCTIAVWWKPQRGFARFYWLCSAPRGSFVRHSGAWQWEQLDREQAWEELPTDILWTTSMHRSCRCVFYTYSTLSLSPHPRHPIATISSHFAVLATDVAYFSDSFSCSNFHWPFPFFIANSVCGWLWCCIHKMNRNEFFTFPNKEWGLLEYTHRNDD